MMVVSSLKSLMRLDISIVHLNQSKCEILYVGSKVIGVKRLLNC
jgi:hypothetical protein